jgi:hypothetical protein
MINGNCQEPWYVAHSEKDSDTKQNFCKEGLSGWIGLTVAIGILLGLATGVAGPGTEIAFAQGGQQYPPNWKPMHLSSSATAWLRSLRMKQKERRNDRPDN